MKKLLLLLSVLFVMSCSKETIKYTLTTSVNPANSGTINPNGGTVDEGQQVSITAAPTAEFVFDKWTGAASGSNETVSVIMDSDKSVTANFIKKKYALTTTVEGEGTITEKVIKAGSATDYNSGTIIELTATAEAGWKFKEWTGDLTGTDNPKQIIIDKTKAVKAIFEALPPFYLDANGVTIKARDWVTVGTVGELNGKTYTAVDKQILYTMGQNGEDVTNVVTTLVTSMSGVFSNAFTFNQDISSWDVSNVSNMTSMFLNAYDFNQDISNWDVSNVTDMRNMFGDAYAFNQDIGGWDVSNVTLIKGMFYRALVFNQDIGSWNISKVTNTNTMFYQANKFNQDLGEWDVSNVTTMMHMFNGASSFNQDISGWNTSKVHTMGSMFQDATAFNQDLGEWDVSNVTNMNYMFKDAEIFNQDLTKWCVTNITSEPTSFSTSSALTDTNKPKWGTCPSD